MAAARTTTLEVVFIVYADEISFVRVKVREVVRGEANEGVTDSWKRITGTNE